MLPAIYFSGAFFQVLMDHNDKAPKMCLKKYSPAYLIKEKKQIWYEITYSKKIILQNF
jgi:hypothetical protein